MREMKCRAWDTETNQWVEGVKLVIHTSRRLLLIPEHTILTWFTGLVDKNGKDIYEGDVVRYTHPAEYDLAGFTSTELIQWSHETSGFELGNISHRLTIYDDVEVIGNMYENPELASQVISG